MTTPRMPDHAALLRVLAPRRAAPTVLATIEAYVERLLVFLDGAAADPAAPVTFQTAVVKATANALTRHRFYTWAYNSAYRVSPRGAIDIRVPLAGGGHTVVRGADRLTLREVAATLAAAGTAGAPDDDLDRLAAEHPFMGRLSAGLHTVVAAGLRLSGRAEEHLWKTLSVTHGTFTIAHIGDVGLTAPGAPIRAPSILELGVGNPFPRETVRGGAVTLRRCVTLTARLDHRMTDVAQAAAFMGDVAAALNDPEGGLGPAG